MTRRTAATGLSVEKQGQARKFSRDFYLVKQEFRYQRPRKFRIEFAKPALFAQGCLTCGMENMIVENYGERYCCTNC